MEICNPYTTFSAYYDSILSHVNHERWKNFILSEFIAQKSRNPAQIIDLGCGTGSLLSEFGELHAEKIGLDISEEMLEVARRNHPGMNFIQGNLLDFSLETKTELLLCTHDTINYLTNLKDLEEHFKCAKSNLASGGLYFFDVTSEYNLLENFHDKTMEDHLPNGRVKWTNKYMPKKGIIKSELEFITKGKIVKEIHVQKYFPPIEVSRLLEKTGFQILKMGSDYKKWKLEETACLVNFLAMNK
ncbi:MAG: methyltransferase domain-containing protein [Leptospiraceae bacterium]|nr:methyltransferase domain-containing protein [Leptospiraceae bacterium]